MAFIRVFFFLLLVMIMSHSLSQGASTFNIVDSGAKPDGKTDSSDALKKSWTSACSATGPATITVPSGRFLVSSPVVFSGTSCKNKAITFKIDGVLVAPDYKVFGDAVLWLSFEYVNGVTISGGTLDGQGKTLWDCKMKGAGDKCPFGVTSLCFTNSQDIVINGLTSTNSQLYHIAINECKNVMLKGVTATAPGDSPNTDGIHVQKSTGVTMLDTKVATGDDCVCLGVGAVNIWIERFACGPGHGISIGSLGKFASEPGVQNVTVKDVKFTGSQNGVRIKSWARASTGFVKGIVFQDATMVNTQNPIIIDQHYCPHAKDCPTDASGVKISDVTFKGIHGSSDTQVAVKIDCSAKFPCQDIKMSDIKLTYKGKTAQATCANAKGVATGAIDPPSCLSK